MRLGRRGGSKPTQFGPGSSEGGAALHVPPFCTSVLLVGPLSVAEIERLVGGSAEPITMLPVAVTVCPAASGTTAKVTLGCPSRTRVCVPKRATPYAAPAPGSQASYQVEFGSSKLNS